MNGGDGILEGHKRLFKMLPSQVERPNEGENHELMEGAREVVIRQMMHHHLRLQKNDAADRVSLCALLAVTSV